MSRMLLCLFLISVSFAFFPFTGEDADTLGKGGLQWETQYAHFKHYDETVHKDVVLQITGGIKDNMDIALIIPYSFYRYKDGTRNDGFSDVGVFIKHIPVEAGNFKAGYKLQLNFNTGKERIGYGKITGNVNLIAQMCKDSICYNTNFVYIKASFVEELRDTYGIILSTYKKLGKSLTLGGEVKLLRPAEDGVNKLDSHILLGGVYSFDKLSVSLGFHKGITRHSTFANWGILAGFLMTF